MALKKTIPVVGGWSAEYIKISEHIHKVDDKVSETYLTVWKDNAERLAAIAGDGTRIPSRELIRVRITDPQLFDQVFAGGGDPRDAIYEAIKTGLVKCDYYFGSDHDSRPKSEWLLYGAEDV